MSDNRLRLTVLLILLTYCSFHVPPAHGQRVPGATRPTFYEGPPGGPMSVDLIPARVPPTRAADPRAAEFAEKYNEVQNQIFVLVRKHRDAKDDERKRLRDQIAELTTQQFDLRHQMRKVEIERIKKHLREVEAKVDKREKLKKGIIEKRITELLDEDTELRWEPLPAGGVYPQIPTTTEMREMVLPDGTRRQIPVTSAAITKFPSLVGGPAVAEAKTRLEIAERKLGRIRPLAEQRVVGQDELNNAQDEVELAKLAFERASMEYAGRRKLLEVGVRRAELDLERMLEELAEFHNINQKTPGAIPATKIRQATAAVEEKKLALETAKTLLELHLLGADKPSAGYPKSKTPEREIAPPR